MRRPSVVRGFGLSAVTHLCSHIAQIHLAYYTANTRHMLCLVLVLQAIARAFIKGIEMPDIMPGDEVRNPGHRTAGSRYAWGSGSGNMYAWETSFIYLPPAGDP